MSEVDVFEALKYCIVVDETGMRRYYNTVGQLHRTDGPAIEYARGTKVWYQNGQCHRIDGPAVEGSGGTKRWYSYGKILTEAEFKEAVKHNV